MCAGMGTRLISTPCLGHLKAWAPWVLLVSLAVSVEAERTFPVWDRVNSQLLFCCLDKPLSRPLRFFLSRFAARNVSTPPPGVPGFADSDGAVERLSAPSSQETARRPCSHTARI